MVYSHSAIAITGKELTSLNGDNPSEMSPPTITMEKDGFSSTEACSIPESTGQDTVRHLDATHFTAEQEALFEDDLKRDVIYLLIKNILNGSKLITQSFTLQTIHQMKPPTILVGSQLPVQISVRIKPQVMWCVIMCQAPPHHCLIF